MSRREGIPNPRQNKILIFIYEYYQEFRHSPSVREIGEAANVRSTSVTNYYLQKLQKVGYINQTPKISRGISLTTSGEFTAMLLMGIKELQSCPHCGAPVDHTGRYKTALQVPKRPKETKRSILSQVN